MRNFERRLHKLEQLPQFQPQAGPLDEIERQALRHLSDEDLQIMINVTRDAAAGVRRVISETESAVVAAHNAAARDTEARRMGFGSFADAERSAGPRR
jgi:hypothetical protein